MPYVPTLVTVGFKSGVYETEKQKIYDYVHIAHWNTDHMSDDSVKLSELWYSSADNDTYIVRANGTKANYVQGDYPICKIELYYCPPNSETPKTIDEVKEYSELVAVLDEADTHYDVSGKKWNISVYYLYRGRVNEV